MLLNRGEPPSLPPPAPEKAVRTTFGSWTLTFRPHLGAPANIRQAKPAFWTDNSDPGVKYFSGTATYSTTLTVASSSLKHLILHLEDVHDIAQVVVNGKVAGLTWAPPYDVDVTGMLHPGANKLEIAVTNEWTNRILGDRSLPADQRVLQGVPPSRFGPQPALPPSGIDGVTLLSKAPH